MPRPPRGTVIVASGKKQMADWDGNVIGGGAVGVKDELKNRNLVAIRKMQVVGLLGVICFSNPVVAIRKSEMSGRPLGWQASES